MTSFLPTEMRPCPDPSRIRPLRVVAKLRNNRLVTAREALGYATAAEAARALGLPYGILVGYECLADSPRSLRAEGGWKPTALRIAAAYRNLPEWFWPPELAAVQKTTSTMEIEVPMGEIRGLVATEEPDRIEDVVEAHEQIAIIEKGLEAVTPWAAGIFRRRHGLGGRPAESLDEIAEAEGCGKERIRQIEKKAAFMVRRRIAHLYGLDLLGPGATV